VVIPTRSASTTSELEYDPWADINDDGIIDILDVVLVTNKYGSTGMPINKTALLLELQARIDSLNASLLDLEAYFETRINTLNATLVEQQSRIADLETQLIILNATKLGKPDYDSDWVSINKGQSLIFDHNLGTTDVLIYMIGYDIDATRYINQIKYGGDSDWPYGYGASWSELTSTTVKVTRGGDDPDWDYVRVMAWKIPQ
jgi:uncharacterized coiled-coil protein SlyX